MKKEDYTIPEFGIENITKGLRHNPDKRKIKYNPEFEKALFGYLKEYVKCINNFVTAVGSMSVESLNTPFFGIESDEELKLALSKLQPICDQMSNMTNIQNKLINKFLKNNITTHVKGLYEYRRYLEHIISYKKSIDISIKDAKEIINEYKIEDKGDEHFIQIAKESIIKIATSYYENNEFINSLSSKIIITDSKGSFKKLPVLKKKK